ncbi:MAG: GspH/FimT family pseudopilin [Halopseudomonas sabulinigri]
MKKAEICGMRRESGFTLLELMITLVVAAIILGLAVPSFQRTIARNAVKATTQDLVATLNAARAQSMSSRTAVTVKPESGGWGDGWSLEYQSSVESDETYVPSDKIRIKSNLESLTFRPQGGLSAPGSSIIVCHTDTEIPGRKITVTFLGRVNTEEDVAGCKS